MEPKKIPPTVLLALGLGGCIDKPVATPCLSIAADDTNPDDSGDDSGDSSDDSASQSASKASVIQRLDAEGRLPADVAAALRR